ncbi:M1 family metallopeptidase [Phaeocystidibacter luteus]|uniref:Aminopeptidase N n=1 Tax=Phaeocystidibacter luteus TaxID=911197 RepID=A0A6N6RH59_9FLAO|nr:M1 family metallopeptidase [Phaeocystidibacter luteus]KAB2810082.1 M1 family peptidase [Phaeocystidibacter luteus]
MKNFIYTGIALGLSIFTIAQTETPQESSEPEFATRPLYRESAARTTDVVHTELKVSFDWDHAYLNGEAILTLKPYFFELDTFVLDAQGMDIHEVKYVSEGRNQDLKYEYDGWKLRIATGKTLTRNDQMKVLIKYTSKPDELTVEGGNAISEAKGLYFINPQDHPRGWMRQVWTQGEPESNSAWFPTVDEPNERMTHEIAITVPSAYQTISNGRLDFKTRNSDGTRTDFWLMDQPHAPYLVMMAVGEFKAQSDEWNGIPVNYWVEPEYEGVARQVYPNTVEMLEFFSERLGTPYPWQKYDQVTVREYVSGAMENTTGVIFGDFMYGDSLSWADGTGEDVVSHEMFHHWFGDLVTCESWANLPLNESFATYGEILWKEYKYGADEAEWHAYADLRAYLSEYSRGKSVDMIRYDYNSVLGMFDRHSYSKGGRILLMLRHILGDDAFFEGLRVYLEDNAYSAVEIHNLRLAMEKVSGQDLNWFFNQWFLASGHPILKVEHEFRRESGEYVVKVTQTQDLSTTPLYRLPVRIDVYSSIGTDSYNVVVDAEYQEFTFEVLSKPFLVHFDADQYLLAEIEEQKPTDFLLHQLAHGPHMMDRYEAITKIVGEDAKGVRKGMILRIGMQDDFHAIRRYALNKVEDLPEGELAGIKETVQSMMDDEDPSVRADAYEVWYNVYGEGDAAFYRDRMLNETSYAAKAGAFGVWKQLDRAAAESFAVENAIRTRGSLSSALIRTILEDESGVEASKVAKMIENAGAEWQSTIHISLPKYLSRLNESDRKSVLEQVDAVAPYLGEAASYYNYGIRVAKYQLKQALDNGEMTQEEYDSRNSVLESLETIE